MRRLVFALLAAVLIPGAGALVPQPAAAQEQAAQPQAAQEQAVPAAQLLEETQLERDTRQLASELRCPVCQGLSLQDSPAELSQEMRAIIREQLLAGKSVEEVKAYFVAKYGEWILLEPEPRGFNLSVYVLPVALLLGGALLLYRAAQRWVQRGSTMTAELPEEEGVEADRD